MITSVTIENFKNLRHLEIGLNPLTVFVGANGSGKTSVLEALDLAVRVASSPHKGLPVDKTHCDWLYTRGGAGKLSVTCTTTGGTFSFAAAPSKEHPPKQADLLGKGHWRFNVSPTDAGLLKNALQPARPMVSVHLNAARLANAFYSDRTPPRVEPDGTGLASVLAYLALNSPEAFDELILHMRELIPHFKRIRFRKEPINRVEQELIRVGDQSMTHQTRRVYQGEAMIFDFNNAEDLSAHTVSEGTLILLGLLTVLIGPNHPNILLMDDIEHGLHPLAQRSLLAVLRQVMQRFPELQIVATAHSPYLLDQLRPEQIRLMTIGDDGYSVCGRLEDHPQFEKWKDEMAPGELWSLFGEKWLVGGGTSK